MALGFIGRRPRRWATAACVLACLVSSVDAQVRVMAPEWLVKSFSTSKGRIDGSTATFGAPFYGERILGKLVYGESKENHTHCTESDYYIPPPEEFPTTGHEYSQVRLIHIALVRRGKCSFVTKVRVAAAKGAHAVIIVDKEDSVLTQKDIQKIIVADDGYGQNIDVPSMLISKEEGQKLIDGAKKSQVIVELAWDVPTNHVVLMDLWMSAGSRESLQFMKDFAPKRKALNEAVKFVPHFHVFGMQSTTDYNDLCSSSDAEYCAEDPDGSGSITGKMVLEEDVRQLCIHDETKVKRDANEELQMKGVKKVEYAEKFWNYVERFVDSCPLDGAKPERDRFGRECAENLMKKVGIDVGKVNECMLANKEEKLKQQREETAWSPRALRINGWRYSGAMDADLVTRAICTGFVNQPDACRQLEEPVNVAKLKQWMGRNTPKQKGVSLTTMMTVLGVIGVLSFGALMLYKHTLPKSIHTALREEVMLEVQSQMASYKQLDGR
eukprot:TRINITY_DN26620_c0_g1_i1.p1 TRINITY_DN26620_c0_g1~~TRINITY_DN26620_c0_g1_i1.p1  ORF type:complete len:546 (+),score=148.81 TRINITY_DN26620_c0_g1_i1:150-1640(+)